tara:strand:- start:68 stop:670 length:603 start_codon:yes stop_codon:yes gene_type:complete
MGDLNPKSVLQGILILLVLFILAYLIYDYFKNRSVEEEFEDYEYVDGSNDDEREYDDEPELVKEEVKQKATQQVPPKPMVQKTESSPRPVPVVKNNTAKAEHPKDCFPKDKLTPEELLPMDAANSEWAQVNPTGQGNVKNQNFLTSGYHMGINSVGSTLRNPNLQLRSEPPNPREKVGPWMQSTIEPDLNRKPLEINGCD